MTATLNINPKNPDSRWIAVNVKDNSKIIAEGKTPQEVIKKAKKTGVNYILSFVPKKDSTYIF
ncbi:MAG: DUF5678 domain-containing protein [Chitinophagales bacterium]